MQDRNTASMQIENPLELIKQVSVGYFMSSFVNVNISFGVQSRMRQSFSIV